MIPITERLRARHEPVGDGTGTWRPDGLCQEAAEIVDAFVDAAEAHEAALAYLESWEPDQNPDKFREILDELYAQAEALTAAALSKAKGKQE